MNYFERTSNPIYNLIGIKNGREMLMRLNFFVYWQKLVPECKKNKENNEELENIVLIQNKKIKGWS